MKTIQSKILLTLIIIFFIIGFTTSAKSIIELPGLTATETEPSTVKPGETNPLAVVYPSSISDYRSQTKEYIKSYSKKQREYIIYIFSKGEKFFPKAKDILETYAIPVELQMIPVLESDFNANAVSPVGAVGYWQFMSNLGRDYGLKISGNRDDRKNFNKSTIAAAKFFKDQLDFFNNDLLLSVAAFNCGPGRVRQSIGKARRKDADFWTIKKYLPAETRRFVMNFIALNVIAANYDKFLTRTMNFNEPPLLQIAAQDSINRQDSLSVRSL